MEDDLVENRNRDTSAEALCASNLVDFFFFYFKPLNCGLEFLR